jgi:hypothetical protein
VSITIDAWRRVLYASSCEVLRDDERNRDGFFYAWPQSSLPLGPHRQPTHGTCKVEKHIKYPFDSALETTADQLQPRPQPHLNQSAKKSERAGQRLA